MAIFGTIGLFVRHIDLAMSEIALLRGLIGGLFLYALALLLKQKITLAGIRTNAWLLLASSIALGCNWVFLFQAFKYTTIANAALSYYFAPVFVLMLSPMVLKEKLSPRKLGCICVATLGMYLVVSNNGAGPVHYRHLLGIAYGLAAAAFYASLMLLNKFIKGLGNLETTLVQLVLASLVLAPYVFLTEGFKVFHAPGASIPFILLLGVLHTGFGFYLFFAGMKQLAGQAIAALSYVDPITSVLVSALVLRENMAALQVAGGVLLLGATFVGGMDDSHGALPGTSAGKVASGLS
jgi:drug/metabolite transporter (DMT)-like permease